MRTLLVTILVLLLGAQPAFAQPNLGADYVQTQFGPMGPPGRDPPPRRLFCRLGRRSSRSRTRRSEQDGGSSSTTDGLLALVALAAVVAALWLWTERAKQSQATCVGVDWAYAQGG